MQRVIEGNGPEKMWRRFGWVLSLSSLTILRANISTDARHGRQRGSCRAKQWAAATSEQKREQTSQSHATPLKPAPCAFGWWHHRHVLFVEFPPTELNYPNWLETMLDRFGCDDKILIGCNLGGLLDKDPVKRVVSDSFAAMFVLKHGGFSNVKYIKGGFCAWRANKDLAAATRGVKGQLPWFKAAAGVREFFPAPCNWVHVKRCACDDGEECTGC
mmetsp:Transcript_27276/g.76978  ORF Transcript_27276/g.76978 Transcript_27276/m.76978 type:complete len:216 (+) Transcript_27276:665-1312(+)